MNPIRRRSRFHSEWISGEQLFEHRIALSSTMPGAMDPPGPTTPPPDSSNPTPPSPGTTSGGQNGVGNSLSGSTYSGSQQQSQGG